MAKGLDSEFSGFRQFMSNRVDDLDGDKHIFAAFRVGLEESRNPIESRSCSLDAISFQSVARPRNRLAEADDLFEQLKQSRPPEASCVWERLDNFNHDDKSLVADCSLHDNRRSVVDPPVGLPRNLDTCG